MTKGTAIIEITDSSIRLVFGNVIDKKPYILYSVERPLSGVVSRCEIIDYSKLIQTLVSMAKIQDENLGLQITLNDAILILPPNGLEVYETDKITNVVSQTSIIEPIDIKNVISLVEKETVPVGSDIVDIVPETFVLENDRIFMSPPIGEKSNSIAVHTKIFTLPSKIVGSYGDALRNSRIRPRRSLVSVYCLTEFVKSIADSPKNYILADLNSGYTSITLIANGSPFASSHFLLGLNDLVVKVSQNFNINESEVIKLLQTYGIDDGSLNFKPSIVTTKTEYGRDIEYTQKELNSLINEFMNEYSTQFETCLTTLLTGCPEEVRRLPIVFSGELLKVRGIKKIIDKQFTESERIMYLTSNYVGARGPEFVTILGALMVGHDKKGSLSEDRAKVSQVNRVDQE